MEAEYKMRKIEKPANKTFWAVGSDDGTILHQGETNPDQVTETGLNDFVTTEEQLSNIAGHSDKFPNLPDEGEQVEKRIYNDNGTLVKAIQSHTRTNLPTEETPALFIRATVSGVIPGGNEEDVSGEIPGGSEENFQAKDSVQGDFEALQALYNSTQGQDLPILSDVSELPANTQDATYPYMYMINGEVHYLKRHTKFKQFNEGFTANWINAGVPWPDKTGWDTMTPETMGDALGIETDANGRVISIDMWRINQKNFDPSNPGFYGNNLAGTLPVEINNLSKIEYFLIKSNFFIGKIPDISNWSNIRKLSFAGQDQELVLDDRRQWHGASHWSGGDFQGKSVVTTNRFLTEIPPLNDMPNLELVELRHQFLIGTIPDWTNLPSMIGILIDRPNYVAENRIGGTFPNSWGNLTSTVFINIDDLSLTGDFPQTINDNWENLAMVSIDGNSFTGPAPEFLKSRDKRYIDISNNEFTGGFPSGYFNGDNANMSLWQIGGLNLTGELPGSAPTPTYPRVKRNYELDAVGMGNNNFTGPLPEWFQSMRNIKTFFIRGNNFTGPFPKTTAELDGVKTFYISDNNFSGDLPDVSWGDRQNNWVFLRGNNFTGEIPDSWISLFAGSDPNMPWSPAPAGDGTANYNTFTGTGSTLTWSAVPNAVAYEIQVLKASDLESLPILNTDFVRNLTIIGTSVDVSGLPSDTYKWRVRGLNWYATTMGGMTLADNNLEGRIPDWPLHINWVNIFNIGQNRYTFRDIGPIYDAFKAKFGDDFIVSPQKPFGDVQTRTMPEGQTVVFDLSEYDYTGNSYQWTKDGVPINGETSAVLTISNVTVADEGSYVLEVNNTDLAELGTQQSQPISFQIGVNDGGNN